MDTPTTNGEPLALIVVKLGRLLERRLNRATAGADLTASQLLVLSLIAATPDRVGQMWRAGFTSRLKRSAGC